MLGTKGVGTDGPERGAYGDYGRLFSGTGALLALALSIILCWPMLIVSAPIGYADTAHYFDHGSGALAFLFPDTPPAVEAPAFKEEADGNPRGVRSAAYSLYFAGLAALPMGLVLVTVVQTALTLLVVFALLDAWPITRRAMIGAFVLAAAITPLPWMASYAMPDILGAAVIAYYAVLVVRTARIGWSGHLVLCAIATFATASHYGNLGVAAGLACVVILISPFFKQVTWAAVLLSLVPVAGTMGINYAASAVALDEAGVVPKRYPIMLARAVEDGPAAWYLDAACPEAGYAICPYFPTMERSVYGVLWSENGVERLSDQEFAQLRQEELTILWEAARAYPAAQAWAFAKNTARQLMLAGTDKLEPVYIDPEERRGFRVGEAEERPALALFDPITNLGMALVAALCIGGIWRNGLRGPTLLASLVIGAGLVGNAAIFGGLSVPVDRYNARAIWLLVPLALIFWSSAQAAKR